LVNTDLESETKCKSSTGDCPATGTPTGQTGSGFSVAVAGTIPVVKGSRKLVKGIKAVGGLEEIIPG